MKIFVPVHRFQHRRSVALLLCLALGMLLPGMPMHPTTARGQSPMPWLPPVAVPEEESAVRGPEATPEDGAIKLIVDTDAGVDDAAAIAWLFAQTEYDVDILGIVTVSGNTTNEDSARNVLTLIHAAGLSPAPRVIIGEKQPLRGVKASRTGKLFHGPDGFWGAQGEHDLRKMDKNAAKFYCDMAAQRPGATLLALGPLTNVAKAVQKCGRAMQNFDRIVILGGARGISGGNRTSVAEFNFWYDPFAAELVFESGLTNLEVVLLEAFAQFTLTTTNPPFFGMLCEPPNDICTLSRGLPVAQLVANPLATYLGLQLANGGTGAVPDVVAAMYALDPLRFLETGAPGLVKVVSDSELARGQSLVGFTPAEKVPMIANDSEINEMADTFADLFMGNPLQGFGYLESTILSFLLREMDNAFVVTAVNEEEIKNVFLAALAPSVTGFGSPTLHTWSDDSNASISDPAVSDPNMDVFIFIPSVAAP